MYKQKAKAKRPSHETRKHGCRRSYLEWCQEVGTWPRIAMSRVLDTRNRTDSSKDSFAASRPNRDRRINFASTISDDVKLISRIFRVFQRLRVARPGGDEKRRPDARLFLQWEVSLSCLHDECARISFFRPISRETRDIFRHAKSTKKFLI